MPSRMSGRSRRRRRRRRCGTPRAPRAAPPADARPGRRQRRARSRGCRRRAAPRRGPRAARSGARPSAVPVGAGRAARRRPAARATRGRSERRPRRGRPPRTRSPTQSCQRPVGPSSTPSRRRGSPSPGSARRPAAAKHLAGVQLGRGRHGPSLPHGPVVGPLAGSLLPAADSWRTAAYAGCTWAWHGGAMMLA